MTYARADLIRESLACLGVFTQADTHNARSQAELVDEALGCLGLFRQGDLLTTRPQAELVDEALGCLGLVRQADTSAVHTRADLVNRAAEVLGVLQQGQTLSSDDYDKINSFVDTVVADLRTRVILTVANVNTAIPGGVFDSLAVVVANAARGFYETVDGSTLPARAQAAEARLQNFTDGSQINEKIPSILLDLKNRGVVTINLVAGGLPSAYFPTLADIVAYSCMEKFRVGPDLAARLAAKAAAAEARLQNFTDGSQINEKLQSIMSDLNDRGIVTIDLAAIPFAYFPTLADIVAYSCMEKFRVGPDLAARLAAKAARAEAILTNLGRSSVVDRTLDAVLAEVATDDLVTVTDTSDIPSEWFRPLFQIVADAVKSNFVLPPDVVQRVAMEASDARDRLRRMTRGRATRLRAPLEFF